MPRNIRLARIADCSAIKTIVDAAYGRYVPLVGKPAPMLDDHAALISEHRVHVLEEDGVIRGLLVLVPEEEAMLLHNIAVSPEAQGRGLGRLLLEFAEKAAREAGYRAIRLYTNEVMTENIILYSRIGYVETYRAVETGRRRVYMTKPV